MDSVVGGKLERCEGKCDLITEAKPFHIFTSYGERTYTFWGSCYLAYLRDLQKHTCKGPEVRMWPGWRDSGWLSEVG